MTRRKRSVFFGCTGGVAILLVVASAAYACTVAAGDATHDFQISPNSASAGTDVGITAEGFCQHNTTNCTSDTGTTNYGAPPLPSYALFYDICPSANANDICAGAVPQHTHDTTIQPCNANDTWLTDSVLPNQGSRTRAEREQIVTGTGTMPGLGTPGLPPDRYIVCHAYQPQIMWNVFTFV